MKKEYINPEMEIVDIKMNQQLLSGSPVGFSGGGSGNIVPQDDDADGEGLAPEFTF